LFFGEGYATLLLPTGRTATQKCKQPPFEACWFLNKKASHCEGNSRKKIKKELLPVAIFNFVFIGGAQLKTKLKIAAAFFLILILEKASQ